MNNILRAKIRILMYLLKKMTALVMENTMEMVYGDQIKINIKKTYILTEILYG